MPGGLVGPGRGTNTQKKKAGMAMEMRQSLRSILVILYCIRFAAADPKNSTVWSYCGNSGKYVYRSGSAFQLNLNKVLDSLVMNVSTSGFNISSVVVEGQNSNNTVYGLLQCRADLDPSDCKQCASTGKANLVEGCQNTSGFIQLDGCFLRYDNHYFYNDIRSTLNVTRPIEKVFCNARNSSQPQQFTNAVKALLYNLPNKAAESPKLFFADSVAASSNLKENIYSLAQCWRDLSRTNCGSCLIFAREQIASCQSGALGAQFVSENCYLRYDASEFFNASILSPPPGESPPSSDGKKPRASVIIIGVVTATLVLIASIGLWKWNICACLKRREEISVTRGEQENSILTPIIANPELIFKYDMLREATSDFKEENKLGQGSFGTVFKGVLHDGREVAVKRLYMGRRHADAEFLNETNLISRVQHRNLVKLLGCSVEGLERLLVYEYLENNSLDKILFGFYSSLIARILDSGYMAPEYALRGQLTEKADVFSFGVLVLEIISGRKNQSSAKDVEFLIDGTWRQYKEDRALEIMDPILRGSYSWEEGIRVIKIGLLCTQAAPALRPSMVRVVSMLTSETEHLPSPTRPAFIDLDFVGATHQVNRGRVVDPDKTSSSAATSSTTHSDIHSAAADPASGTLQPR